MYDGMRAQIEREATARGQDWSAQRACCEDGSIAFLGSKGPALVITPGRDIAIGKAYGGSDALIDVSRTTFSGGGVVFPTPNLQSPGAKVL
jgi:hypothetical protein